MTNPTDCLVLEIEEFDGDTNCLDNTLFVFYDSRLEKYILRGCRKKLKPHQFVPYSFTCKSVKKLRNFIKLLIGSTNKISLTLYNYDNLAYDSNDIYYECLKTNEGDAYELVGYDGLESNSHQLLSMLQTLKNIANESNR